MSLTLSQLRSSVFRRLGDSGYPDSPSAATVDAVDCEINDSIADHVYIIESRGYKPLFKQRKIFTSIDYRSQTIKITGASGGKFKLTWLGRTTGDINYGASAATIDARLTAIDDLTYGDFQVGVVQQNDEYNVVWPGSPLDVLPFGQTTKRRPVIPAITADSSDLTGSNPAISVTLVGSSDGAFQQEYHLDTYQTDSSGQPDFRGHLYIERTDSTTPIPVEWPERGDHRLRNEHGRIQPAFPSGENDAGGHIPFLYKRGRVIGYVFKQTENQTLTSYYSAIVPKLVNQADTIGDIGLGIFEQWKNLIVLRAARRLHADIASSVYQMVSIEYDREFARFLNEFAGRLDVTGHQRRSRWSECV